MWAIEVLKDLSGKWKTQQQKYLSLLLEEKWVSVDTLLASLIDIATNACKTTPIGELVDDYKTRLTAVKLLLELSWDYTPAKQNVSVNLWFANMFYWNKEDGGTIIQAGQADEEWGWVY